MVEDNRRFKSTSELAFANIGGAVPSALPGDHLGARGQVIRGVVGGDQAAQIQREIDATMRGLVADIRRGGDPLTAGGRLPTVTPAGAAPVRTGGNGWRDSGPLRPVATPLAEAVIEAMTHQALPHSPGNSAFRGPSVAFGRKSPNGPRH
jgi:hypothetical protein